MRRPVHFVVVVALAATLIVGVADTPARAAGGLIQVGTLGGPGHAEISPSGLELSDNGSVLAVADTGNNRIKKYTRSGDGTYTKVWDVGGFGSAAGKFNNPRDVGLDDTGNVYVSDSVNARVVKLHGTTGAFIAAFKGTTADKFGTSLGLTVSNDKIYMADSSKRKVRVLGLDGVQQRAITGSGACALSQLRDVTADSNGNIYVANYTLNNIVKFSPTGVCLAAWGTKGTANGQFANPYGVDIGTDGGNPVIFVADSNNNRIQEFTLSGGFLRAFGAPGPYNANGTFTAMRRVAVSSGGFVCGADLWGWRIACFQGSAQAGYAFERTIPPTPQPPPGYPENPFAANKTFNEVRQVTFDATGNTYVADGTNHRMIRFDNAGMPQAFCGGRADGLKSFNWPRGIAFDASNGRTWVADTKQSRLQIIRSPFDSCSKFTLGRLGTSVDKFSWPTSVVIRQSDRTVWFADSKNHRVSVWDAVTRKPIRTFGALGAGTNQFSEPRGVAITDTGDILVADTKNKRIVRLTATAAAGTISWARTYAVSPAFKLPEGVAGDATRVYVADTGNNRVVVLDASSGAVLQTVGGFLAPSGVAVDRSGRVFVSDTYNDVVKIFDWR